MRTSERNRKRLYIRPYTPWKRNSQLGATSTAATKPTRGRAESAPERGDQGQAPEREDRRDESESAQPEAEVRHTPGEQEVEGRAAAFLRDVLDDAGQRVAADEQGERLVLVRRPRHQLVEEERGGGSGDAGDADPQPVTATRCGRSGGAASRPPWSTVASIPCVIVVPPPSLVDWPTMPIYEYRCPNGHTFEVFQRMSRPAGHRVRDVRGEPRGEAPVPGRRALQGLGLLLDRLRPRLRKAAKDADRRPPLDGRLGQDREARARRADSKLEGTA